MAELGSAGKDAENAAWRILKHALIGAVFPQASDLTSGFLSLLKRASEMRWVQFLQMAGVFAQLELAMIRARVRSGMENARAKGKQVGRRPTTKDDIPAVFYKHYPAFAAGQMNVSEFARVCGLSRPTIYKYMRLVGYRTCSPPGTGECTAQ